MLNVTVRKLNKIYMNDSLFSALELEELTTYTGILWVEERQDRLATDRLIQEVNTAQLERNYPKLAKASQELAEHSAKLEVSSKLLRQYEIRRNQLRSEMYADLSDKWLDTSLYQ